MKRKIILFIKIVVTASILAYLFIKIPFYKIISTFSSVNLPLFFTAVLTVIVVTFLSSLQTKYLTKTQKMLMSFKEIFGVYLTTAFYSLFLPGAVSGGAIKWYKFSKYGSKSSAAAIIVFNRFLETFVVAILGMLYSIPTLIKLKLRFLLLVWVIILILLILTYYLLLNENFLNKISNLFEVLPVPSFVKKKILSLFGAMREFQNLTFKQHLEILGIMICYHVIDIFGFYLVALSINVSVNFFVLGWIASAITLSSLIPISYAGLGLREGFLVYILRYYGVAPQDALVIALLSFTKDLSIPIIGGFLELKNFFLGKNYKSFDETSAGQVDT
jgi:glycosyltransferase 2 family protein